MSLVYLLVTVALTLVSRRYAYHVCVLTGKGIACIFTGKGISLFLLDL